MHTVRVSRTLPANFLVYGIIESMVFVNGTSLESLPFVGFSARLTLSKSLVQVLPTMLHVSLGLFLAGLIRLLWSLNTSIGIGISIVVLIGMTFCCVLAMLPLVAPGCPYRTPLTSELGRALHGAA